MTLECSRMTKKWNIEASNRTVQSLQIQRRNMSVKTILVCSFGIREIIHCELFLQNSEASIRMFIVVYLSRKTKSLVRQVNFIS
jgi:hypothetical protein